MIYLDWFGHCFSDSSIEELYDFGVNKLGLKPEWNHYSRCFPHFDLTTAGKKALAKKCGAIYIEDSLIWKQIVDGMKNTFKETLPYYKCKGLHGQDILRVDFKKLGLQK